METSVYLKSLKEPKLDNPIAIVGAPGLRSVGKLVVDNLLTKTNAQLFKELYSPHLPSIYETKPAYAAHPAFPGSGGAIAESGELDLPKINFYFSSNPEIIIVKGYHPNFTGQYAVAEKVVEILAELKVKRMIVAAGFGSKDKKIFCAATNIQLLNEMKEKYDIGTGYKGPFMGFSGLVFGLAKLKGIESVCLFSSTQPKEDDLEFPDNEASERIIEKLNQILSI